MRRVLTLSAFAAAAAADALLAGAFQAVLLICAGATGALLGRWSA